MTTCRNSIYDAHRYLARAPRLSLALLERDDALWAVATRPSLSAGHPSSFFS